MKFVITSAPKEFTHLKPGNLYTVQLRECKEERHCIVAASTTMYSKARIFRFVDLITGDVYTSMNIINYEPLKVKLELYDEERR